jgi:hypothetical protein
MWREPWVSKRKMPAVSGPTLKLLMSDAAENRRPMGRLQQ